jgi:hypothetical protein
MGKAKQLTVKPISSKDANELVRKWHYSGKVAPNSQLHFGVFLKGICGGVMQFGPSLDKKRMINLVKGTSWNGFLELNRMAFADFLPKNSESRCIAIAIRFIKKTYPWIKWIVSFSDATQCGDGTIYRASGFVLTQIKKNSTILQFPSGERVTDIGLKQSPKAQIKFLGKLIGGTDCLRLAKKMGAVPAIGFQLRYVYFIDKSCAGNLNASIIPFSKIKEAGAAMYKGKSLSAQNIDSDVSSFQGEKGGASPTCALQPS